jgi:hypothetical protein
LSSAQVSDFGFCQRAPFASRQIAQTQISDSNPDQSFHFVANGVEHSPDLLIDPLAKHDAQSGRADGLKSCNLSALTVEKNSARELLRMFVVPWAI